MSVSTFDLTEQRKLCAAQVCAFAPVSGDDKVGFASLTLGMKPVNGLRHPVSGDTTGWYIWCGETFSDAPDFFEPLCVDHLIEKLPLAANLLGLPLATDSWLLTMAIWTSGSTKAC